MGHVWLGRGELWGDILTLRELRSVHVNLDKFIDDPSLTILDYLQISLVVQSVFLCVYKTYLCKFFSKKLTLSDVYIPSD